MKSTNNAPDQLHRRSFLRIAGMTGAGWIMGTSALTLLEGGVGKLFMPLNDRLDALLLNPQKPVPEFPTSTIEPEALITNTFRFTPMIDLNTFRLSVDGEVKNPLNLDLARIQQLPLTSMVIRHVCVEGWAAIVQWGGVRLSEIVKLAQPKPGVRYVYFQSADGYYESWDLASALHPQTLLAYQKNGAPLPVENGAPLRLAAPIKLGYKQSKWVTRVTLTSQLLPQKGYWEDQGYEWFAGL
ncbi:molybdopterin-dependent oxidoreductase [Kovacikia minuta CCNUW1]|uniref:molybdopterin-dependent oxidoreductase n=1 Tax=Kovacikia minuta TaxID=2931930 RepID=UPI001CCCF719|nr:molybdopterin-dependent oxidoreductase [Kovacikia minuta]UBF24903.1 molybdopterin-dependent oxidoreductase [Kovacikia minuta CCNUW1]